MYSETHVVTLMDDVSQLWTVSFRLDSLIARSASSPPQSSVFLIGNPGKGVLEVVQLCPPWPYFSFLPRLNKGLISLWFLLSESEQQVPGERAAVPSCMRKCVCCSC